MSNDSNNTPNATGSTGVTSRSVVNNENERPRIPAQTEPLQMASPVMERLVLPPAALAQMEPIQTTPSPTAPAANLLPFQNAVAQDVATAQNVLIDAVTTLNNLMSANPYLQGPLAGVKDACNHAISTLDRRDNTFGFLARALVQAESQGIQLRAVIENQNDQLLIHERNFDVLQDELENTEQILQGTERENRALLQDYRLVDSQIQRQELALQQAYGEINSFEQGLDSGEDIVEQLQDDIRVRDVAIDVAIDRRDKALQDQDQLIATFNAHAQETLQSLADKDNTIRDQEEIIVGLQTEQLQHLVDMEELDQKMDKCNNMVEQKTVLVEEILSQVEKLKEELLKRPSHQTAESESMEVATNTGCKRRRIEDAAPEDEARLRQPRAMVAEPLSEEHDDQVDLVQNDWV